MDETRYDHPINEFVVSQGGQTNITENSEAEYCRNSLDTAESFLIFQQNRICSSKKLERLGCSIPGNAVGDEGQKVEWPLK